MKIIQRVQMAVVSLFIVFASVGVVTIAAPAPIAMAKPTGCKSTFLTFPAWYRGLLDSNCNIKAPDDTKGGAGLSNFIWHIVLNVLEIVLQLVAYLAVGYVIYGGFKYLTSTGFPDRTASARKIILNAIIGLILSMLSVAIVNLIGRNIQ